MTVFFRALAAVVLALCLSAPAAAQPATPLYRVFLADGSALASFGEWALAEDRIVFAMPTAGGGDTRSLQLISLPLARVDMPRTERYADAVRAAHYAATRGEADFAQLSSTVAAALNQIALLQDPHARLATAEQARKTLTAWPATHHGYKAVEVSEIIGVLDEVISGLRAAAGDRGFELALSTTTLAPPSEPLLPEPSPADTVTQLMAAAKAVDSPAEKVSLLQSLVQMLDRAVDFLPASVASALRATAVGEIAEEERVNGAYAAMRATVLGRAAQSASRADVRALEVLRDDIRAEDARLGGRRADEVTAMLASIEAHLDAARRLRLAQDQWLLAERDLKAYRHRTQPFVQTLVNSRASLDDIKLLAGPAPQRLQPLARRLEAQGRQLALVEPPAALVAVHALLRSVYALAVNAVQLRRDAVRLADLALARQAAAAAAGALMLLDRARDDLRAALEPPLPARTAAKP